MAGTPEGRVQCPPDNRPLRHTTTFRLKRGVPIHQTHRGIEPHPYKQKKHKKTKQEMNR